ncbi:hypothetical protein RN001_014680 [Aquatica leii]|uniref:G-protein coupled receptors family 2 profile 2 domain-containing protein n=1 Tax=Aquatica leii TaxID=1421715 RepID=A0AAN7NZX6_9COLE|nr:hypothetical protein RN001_014680 [Aquatica leii]
MSEEKSLEILNRFSYIGMIIALPFITMSFLAYALLSLRHGHAKSLLCYLASFFGVYLLYVVISYVPDRQHVPPSLCISLVLLLIYFIFAQFFWMNVLCFDGWKHMGDASGYWEPPTIEKQLRFWLYSAYAWGMPLFLALLIFAISKAAPPKVWYNPGLDDDNCWLNDGVPIFIFLYLPLTVTIIVDIILLVVIGRRLKENEEVRGNKKKKKYRFIAHIQIFTVLFFIWLMEIITGVIIWADGVAPDGYWYFMEVFNALTGIITFAICIFKKTLCMLLQRRFHEIRRGWRKKYSMSSPRRGNA